MQWGQAIFEISLEMFKNSSRTGKSFSEVVVCQNFFECQNKTKTTICVHNMSCRYSELKIFMKNEQSAVILWVTLWLGLIYYAC